MEAAPDQLQLIGMMAACEAAVGALYRRYAERFPQYSDLFGGLARDEVEHARRITDFARQVRSGAVRVDAGRFDSWTIVDAVEQVRQQTLQATDGEVSPLDALAISVALEDSFIERQYFAIIEGDAEELRVLLQGLEDDSRAHRAKVQRAWAAAQPQAS